ncbi:MAG TPA: aldehyde ferredoxin oxidoreductase N-terminal domain-containing protein [Myxococcales bacterium]|jgi:glyceraldehyde-3-phosphate dehydrogenase (ferredoxin)
MPRNYRALFVSAADGSHEYRPIDDKEVIGVIDFAWKLGDAGKTYTVIGSGPIAGSFVPGSNRLVVCGHSPIWNSFFPSTMGGAGLPWEGIGANFLAIGGRAAQPSVLHILNVKGIDCVEIAPIDVESVWRGYRDETGVYALMHQVWDTHGAEFKSARVLATGPSAARTRIGAICSVPVVKGALTHIDTWAGRGGLGSRLFQQHNIAAVIYGGDYEDVDLTDRKLVDGMFDKAFKKPLKLVDLEKTTKYRFDPKFKTAGTFGSNFHALKEKVLSFNYQSVNWPDERRLGIHDRLIEPHYVKQFDQETVETKQNFNCGEPCGAVCKKLNGKFKKDYEPYQSLGPLIGVFDQRAAEKANRCADAAGFDGIQIGGEVAWIMEGLEQGWLGEEQTGIKEKPHWDPEKLDAVADSAHNADIAVKVIHWLLDDPRAADFRQGIRHAANKLGGKAKDAAVYSASGDGHGCLVPNQYWVPGMFSPMPILGRYYLDYGTEYKPPFELGKACGVRMGRELMLDNYGMCRFHRGWAEPMLPQIVDDFQGEKVDSDAHHRKLAVAINGLNQTRFWETERVCDMVATYLFKAQKDQPKDATLDGWVEKFRKDKWAAGREYWQAMKDGLAEGLKAPPAKT